MNELIFLISYLCLLEHEGYCTIGLTWKAFYQILVIFACARHMELFMFGYLYLKIIDTLLCLPMDTNCKSFRWQSYNSLSIQPSKYFCYWLLYVRKQTSVFGCQYDHTQNRRFLECSLNGRDGESGDRGFRRWYSCSITHQECKLGQEFIELRLYSWCLYPGYKFCTI